MARFYVNKGWGNENEYVVEAEDYQFDALFVTFFDEDSVNVFSIPLNKVGRIEREGARQS